MALSATTRNARPRAELAHFMGCTARDFMNVISRNDRRQLSKSFTRILFPYGQSIGFGNVATRVYLGWLGVPGTPEFRGHHT